MGNTIAQRLAANDLDPELGRVFRQPVTILETAAMSLGFEDVITALDLCADAVLLISGHQRKTRNGDQPFHDLGTLKSARATLNAAPRVAAWVNALFADPTLEQLLQCRHHLAHRRVDKYTIGATFAAPAGGFVRIQRSEITTPHGVYYGPIHELTGKFLRFGEDQLEGLCHAILLTI